MYKKTDNLSRAIIGIELRYNMEYQLVHPLLSLLKISGSWDYIVHLFNTNFALGPLLHLIDVDPTLDIRHGGYNNIAALVPL